MRKIFFLLAVVGPMIVSAQNRTRNLSINPSGNSTSVNDSLNKSQFGEGSTSNITPEAPIDWYKIISIHRDTIVMDTALTIKKEYRFNYLRKDLFGLLALPNEGQPYNLLNFGLRKTKSQQDMGFSGKHFAYMEVEDIKYYHVPTPMTDLHYKSVMERGQMLDAFITVNTSEQFNFSVAYKGIRSIGKYINSRSSNGNFRFTTSYRTQDGRYIGNYHLTAQDFENQENGGIVNIEDFESGRDPYTERARLDVHYKDAISLLKGKRLFVDHSFRINPNQNTNNLRVLHQFYFEDKDFEFRQGTVSSRLGASYVSSNINDQTEYYRIYNRLGGAWQNENLGDFAVFVDDFRSNYHYNRITLVDDQITIPDKLKEHINTLTGSYTYYKNNWKGVLSASRAISNHSISDIHATLNYQFNADNKVSLQYQNLSKLPDAIFNLHQSSYLGYNWSHDFKNEKINSLVAQGDLKWLEVKLNYSNLKDHLFFSNDAVTTSQVITTPKQYEGSINYFSAQVGKEFKFGPFALDNTLLYQKVDQSNPVVNVPEFVTRNTFYYSGYVFKKAMFIQTGFTLNYFTKYYANDYSPVIGEFFVQNERKIGNFPMLDFFINAKVSTAQIFLKAEHFNSSFTGYHFYSTPNQPYRDFIIRFGISWNFFS